jgi:predicted XRE-type DNA-binding protein
MGRKEAEEAIADSLARRVTRVGSVAERMAALNVYAALDYPDADEMLVKARLVTKIGEAIKARQLSNEQAATALGLTPGELSELLAGRFRAHQVDTLERLASVFDEARR